MMNFSKQILASGGLLAMLACGQVAPADEAPAAPVAATPASAVADPKKPGKAARFTLQEAKFRELMGAFGASDPEMQDAILTFLAQEEKARMPIRQQSRRLMVMMNAGNVPEAQLRTLIDDFRAALDTERARHATAETALDLRIGFSHNPRLEGMLMLLGVIGDTPVLLPSPGLKLGNAQTPRPVAGESDERAALREFERVLLRRFDRDRDGQLEDDERTDASDFVRVAIESLGLVLDRPLPMQGVQTMISATKVPSAGAEKKDTVVTETPAGPKPPAVDQAPTRQQTPPPAPEAAPAGENADETATH